MFSLTYLKDRFPGLFFLHKKYHHGTSLVEEDIINISITPTKKILSKLYEWSNGRMNNSHTSCRRGSRCIRRKARGMHPIKVTFFEKGGDEILKAEVQTASFAKRMISSSELFMEDVASTSLEIPDINSLNLYPNP